MLAVSLLHRIKRDLKSLGLPVNEVDWVVYKRYCSTYWGRYYSTYATKGRPKIKIYPYQNKNKDMYPYDILLSIAIHEMVHHLQFMSDDYVRYEGLAHDPDFWDKYNHYIDEAKRRKIIRFSLEDAV